MPSPAASRSLVAALLLLGCSTDANSNPSTGSEGGACYPNATCDAGLVCASELCVLLPEGTSSGSAEGNGAEGSSANSDDPPSGDGEGSAGDSDAAEETGAEETGTSAGETGEGADESAGSRGPSCPFSIDQISCASFCEADLYYSEVCNNGGATTSYDECFEACEYTVSNDLLDESPIGIEWYGCMQETGGACDDFLDCFHSTSC